MQPQSPTFEAKVEQTVADLRSFLILWVGQLVSGLGSGLTAFAIPVWVYQKTGSVEQFGLLMFAAAVPALAISPFAGALVDRWDRRTVLILGDVGAALMTLGIAYLFWTNNFEVWHLFGVVAFGAALGAFQEPAFGAAISMLVPREHLGRASGIMQTGASATAIVTPLAAGALLPFIGIPGILLIDFATFLVAMGTLLLLRIPNPPPMPEMAGQRPSLFREAMYGWHFIAERRGLMALLLFFAVINFGMGNAMTLLNPMVLSFSTITAAGIVGSVVAIGGLIGGILMSTWGGPKRRIHGVLAGGVVVALCLAASGLRPSLALVTVSLFGVTVFAPIVVASSQAIWMSKTPPQVMGRVFAMRKLIAMSALPLAALTAGPLAERVFEPLMMPGSALAGSVGAVIGVGEGRGIALMLMVIGVTVAALTALMYLVPVIRDVETQIPDAVHPGMPGMPMPPQAAPAAEAGGEEAPAHARPGVAGIQISSVQAPEGGRAQDGGEPVAAPGTAPAGA